MRSKISLFVFLFIPALMDAQWSVMCNSGNGFVDNFEVYNNELYATGFFTTACSVPANYVSKWDGTNWTSVGAGLDNSGHHLQAIGAELFAAIYQPNVDSNWLFKFDGTDFNKFGEGFYLSTAVPGFSQTANLYNVIDYDSTIVVCGEFDRVGNNMISGIAKWNGQNWDSLGSGFLGNIPGTAPVMYPHDMCKFGNDLVVAGNFRYAGGQIVNGIARWDGVNWYPFGQGMNSTVYAVCVFNGDLYAAGDFTMSGTNSVNYIAKWNGSDWVDPGFGFYYVSPTNYTFIHTMKVFNNKLFISGGFDRVTFGSDTMLCSAIAVYDGSAIDTLLGGIPGKEIEAIAFYNGNLVVGGGLNGSSYIAQYDFTNSVHELNVENNVKLFSNPSRSVISLEADDVINEITVIDADGKLTTSTKPNSSSASVSISKGGIYFVQIITKKYSVVKKVLVIE